MDNQKLNIGLTAEKLVELLQSVPNKVDSQSLLEVLPETVAGLDRSVVCNAIAIVNALSEINNDITSDKIVEKIDNASDANLLTDDQMSKIGRVSDQFRGVFVNNNTRNDHFASNPARPDDMILNLSNDNSQPSIQYWNNVLGKWDDVYDTTGTTRRVVSTATTGQLHSFSNLVARSATLHVTASAGTTTRCFSVTVFHNGSSGASVFVMPMSNMGSTNAANLVTFTASVSGGNVLLNYTTHVAAVTLRTKLISQI